MKKVELVQVVQTFRDAKNMMQFYLKRARQDLVAALKAELAENSNLYGALKNANPKIDWAQGRETSINDRSDYLWIKFIIPGDGNLPDKEYWLTLFYNEVDEKRGNYHTQIGRIQFWKGINNCTPNVKGSDGKWQFIYEKSDQPCNKPTYIGDADYCPKTVVSEFLAFITEDIKTKEVEK